MKKRRAAQDFLLNTSLVVLRNITAVRVSDCECMDLPLTQKVEQIWGRLCLRHSFRVCVWACLRWTSSSSHVHPLLHFSLSFSLSGFFIHSLHLQTVLPSAHNPLFVFLVCFRLSLLGKHAVFSWLRFCHLLSELLGFTCTRLNAHLEHAPVHKKA